MKRINAFNEWIGVHVTLIFGTMWITYLFFVYGFLPILIPSEMTTLLYWSNTVQLWSLPLLMVGQNVMGRSAEKRAEEDHETLMKEFIELKQMHSELRDENAEIRALVDEMHHKHIGLIEVVEKHVRR